jgi:hypothetical protein
MARTGRTQDTGTRLAPQDVLAGHVVPSAQELVDIQRIQRPLDRAWIREAREEQTLARLAEIYLNAPVVFCSNVSSSASEHGAVSA